MSEEKRFVFPMKVYDWEVAAGGFPYEFNGSVGFIPVYEDIETYVSKHGVNCPGGTFKQSSNKANDNQPPASGVNEE